MSALSSDAWLVAVDLQRIFGEPGSEWFTPDFERALSGSAQLAPAFGDRVALTRFVAPTSPSGAWVDYYAEWPFALDPRNAPLYDLVSSMPSVGATVVSRETFGKWDAGTATTLGSPAEIVLTGVSTECCVLATALAAADAGVHVRVATDACAGVTDADHERALAVMALYAPLIELTTVAEMLAGA